MLVCGIATAFSLYQPGDFLYKYWNNTKQIEFTDSVCGTVEIEGKTYDIYGVTPWSEYEYGCTDYSMPPLLVEGDKVLIRIEGGDLFDFPKGETRDVLLYDFGYEAGDIYKGFIFDRFQSYFDRQVTHTRRALLFGSEQKVLGVGTSFYEDDLPGSPSLYWGGKNLHIDLGEYFVVVENIGAVTLPGYYNWPAIEDSFVGYQTGGSDYWPRFTGVTTRDGKYSYSRTDLGVRAHNQLVLMDQTWMYYSETPDAEAVHFMSFDGTEERDGNTYRLFSTSKVILKDKATGEIREIVNPDRVANSWLMRENLGEVYVREYNSDTETLLYDFMLQTGQTFGIGGNHELEAIILRDGGDRFPARVSSIPVKTYSFVGYDAKMGVTEAIGVWGEGAGCIAHPSFADESESAVAWPWGPASDCTLARVEIGSGKTPCYTDTKVYEEKVLPLLDYVGVDMTASKAEEARWYTLQGMRVSEPKHGQLLIRVSGGKAEKVRY
ncbi:MAG: hypothetical protein K2O24_09020 [Muribaculaceae bacterium]|nr:hypothetical protein [Muribaculaceae bacterium]